jgi:hypothetical protein
MGIELDVAGLQRAGGGHDLRRDLLAEAERHGCCEPCRHDDPAFAGQVHVHEARLLLEHHPVPGNLPAVALAGARQHEGSADIGVAGEGHLGLGGEDADLGGVSGVLGRQHERRFGQVELGGDGLHALGRKPPHRTGDGIGHDGQRIAAELAVGEDIDGGELEFHDFKSATGR